MAATFFIQDPLATCGRLDTCPIGEPDLVRHHALIIPRPGSLLATDRIHVPAAAFVAGLARGQPRPEQRNRLAIWNSAFRPGKPPRFDPNSEAR
jgi:hypothetical protein